jgi:hypothetical protein
LNYWIFIYKNFKDVNEKIKILDEAQRLFRNKDDLSLSVRKIFLFCKF